MDSEQKSSYCIPDHKLIRCIGQGSYGQVWLAQNVLNAFRAVKIVSRKDFTDEAPFHRELNGIRRFEPLSRTHPGFINVLHVGYDEAQGYFYYVMELGDDTAGDFSPETYSPKTLHSVLRSGERLSPVEVVGLGLRLTDALHHLHESGLIHRDIKPSNILFVGGLPKLADIGLVSTANEARSLVGTPGYIPPEGPGTRQADIYALGKVFYEALTGLGLNQFPELPTFFDGHLQEDLFLEINEIITRACHQNLAVRYPSARALHAELVAIENGHSVVRLHELERKWAKTKRWLQTAAIAAAIAVMVVWIIVREWTQAELDRQQTAGLLIGSGIQAVRNGDHAQALRDSTQVLKVLRDERSQAINRRRYAMVLGQIPKLVLLESFGTRIWWSQFASDDQNLLVSLNDGRCRMVDGGSSKVIVEYPGHTNAVLYASVSSDGKHVASAGMDGTTRVWDRWSGRLLLTLAHPCPVSAIAIHPGGAYLVTGAEDGVVRFWDCQTGESLQEIRGHSKQIDGVQFSHTGELFVTAGRDNQARVWNWATKQPVGEAIRHGSWVAHAAFSPDGQRLVTGCHDSFAYVWVVGTQRLVAPPLRHERAVRHVAVSPDGNRILTAGWDNVVRQWNTFSGLPEGGALKHSSPVMRAAYSPDGRKILTGCIDGTLRVWDQAGKASPRLLHAGVMTVSSDGSRYLTRNATNLEIYRTTAPSIPEAQIPIRGKFRGAFPNRDGSLVALVTQDSQGPDCLGQIWRTTSPLQPVQEFSLRHRPGRIVFGHRGDILIALFPNSAELIDFGSPRLHRWLLALDVAPTNAFFSLDDRSAAIISGTNALVIECQASRLRFDPLRHRIAVSHAAFSADGQYLVTCTSDGDIRASYAQVWDCRTGAPVGGQRWHTDGIEQAAWFPDNQRFVTVGEDGVGKIWRLHSDTALGSELKHDHQIEYVAMGALSQLILTGGRDFSARLWDAESGAAIGAPLVFPHNLASVGFANHERDIVAHDFSGNLFLSVISDHDLPETHRVALADLLAGRLAAPVAGDEFDAAKAHAAAWHQLKTTHPAGFLVASGDVVAWHRMEAEHSRALKQRRAELFHLDRLLHLMPEERSLKTRQKYLQDLLAAEIDSASSVPK